MSKIQIPEISGYVEKRGKNYKFIPNSKVRINRNTPVGDPAEFFESKPYGGKREFYPLLEIKNGVVVNCHQRRFCYEKKRWEFLLSPELVSWLENKNIILPLELGDGTMMIKS